MIFFLIAAGTLLRIYRLGYHDLWFDESYAVVIRSNEIFKITDVFPLFYVILHQWIHLFGSSEFSLRLLPSLFSICSIPLIYLIGHHLFDQKVGIFSATILAFSPFHLWYAQEVQPYSTVVFFALLISYLFFKAVETNKKIFWWFFELVYILGLYIHESLFFLILVQIIYLFFKRRDYLKFLKSIIISLFILFLLKITTIINLLNLLQTRGFWIPKPTILAPLITLENHGFGYNLPNSVYLISNILITLILISAIKNLKGKINFQQNIILCLIAYWTPIISIFFFSIFYFPIYTNRLFIPFSPFYYLILAFGVTSIQTSWKRYSCSFALILLLIVGIGGYFNDYTSSNELHRIGLQAKKPFKPAVKFIEKSLLPNDIIAHASSESITPFIFYFKKNKIIKQYFITSKLIKNSFMGFYAPEISDSIVVENMSSDFRKKRLWFICVNGQRKKELDPDSEIVKQWLDNNFKQDLAREFYGVWVFRYSPTT